METTDPTLTGPSESPATATTKESKHSTEAPHSPKRKASEVGNSVADTTSSDGKRKRRKVNHACVYCRRSHMTCDLERPCARCVKRDIGHLCHDEPREPPKRSKSDIGAAELASAPGEGMQSTNGHMAHVHGNGNGNGNGMSHTNGTSQPQLVQPTTTSPGTIPRPMSQRANSSAGSMQNVDWNNNGVQSQFQDMHHLHPNYMFNTSEVTNEYNLLNDFLSSSIMEDGAMYTDSNTQALFEDPLLATSSMNAHVNNPNFTNLNSSTQQPPTSNAGQQQRPRSQPMQPPIQPNLQQVAAGHESSRHSSTYPIDSRARDKFYMTAADPAGFSSAEDRLHKLLKAKYDAGMLKPFNYVRGYARLNQYMSKNLSRESQLRILKQLDRFRPKFREAMQSLTDMQLVLVEMWFERSLMEYDRVFASMAIPACCWRRTGEIFRGNAEMAELVRVPVSSLRDGKMAIHEIVKEDSLVSYWEKFGAIAFDQSQKAILTSCTLLRPARWRDDSDGEERAGKERDGKEKEKESGKVKMEVVKCCFSFTIRRDTHNIPSLIVGNFLPITERKQPNGQQQ